ncbi:MAG: hypothetical protein JXR77_07615 [Lentisphaeria bacterium]|nr:hypothetical protein [Lentisphaeria bacterium]
MASYEDLWYAARMTRIVYSPPRLLETFGETSVRYSMLTEVLDEVGRVRIREGRVSAQRPRVITPHYFVNQALVNFGEEARRYIEDVLRTTDGVRILEYGLQFLKEEYSEEVVAGAIDDVADQVEKTVRSRDTELWGVVIGVDDHWEVSLLRFVKELVQRSMPHNARAMAERGLLHAGSGNVPNAVRIEIESDFRQATGNRERARELGEKLRAYGLFGEYEDRFFELFRSSR